MQRWDISNNLLHFYVRPWAVSVLQAASSLTSNLLGDKETAPRKLYFFTRMNIFSLRFIYMSLCRMYSQQIFQFLDSGLSPMTAFIDVVAKMYQ